MRFDLYQAETARIANEQGTLLAQAQAILSEGRTLTALEESGVLHALQVLIENAIGKAKQQLKHRNLIVPVSAYDAFKALTNCGLIARDDLDAWNTVIGLRNRIVHAYMNIDMDQITALLKSDKHGFIIDFLERDKTFRTDK